jgi:hypothetical protein
VEQLNYSYALISEQFGGNGDALVLRKGSFQISGWTPAISFLGISMIFLRPFRPIP